MDGHVMQFRSEEKGSSREFGHEATSIREPEKERHKGQEFWKWKHQDLRVSRKGYMIKRKELLISGSAVERWASGNDSRCKMDHDWFLRS